MFTPPKKVKVPNAFEGLQPPTGYEMVFNIGACNVNDNSMLILATHYID